MNVQKKGKILIAVGLQIVIILSIILYKLLILGNGTEVLLKVEPVDPRDPFRGDYVTMRYSISNANYYPSSYGAFSPIKNGEQVYVILYKSGKYWSVSRVTRDMPTQGTNELFLRGTVVSGGSIENDYTSSQDMYTSQTLQINYGIEEYFIPEGTGRDFNGQVRSEEVAAVVRIDDTGNAVLKQVLINDTPWQ